MSYVYGMVTLNNGEHFRARQDEETGKVSFMGHNGQQNASAKISKSFKPNYDAAVKPSNKYLFPDEYHNPNMSNTNSKGTTWKNH